MIDAATLDGLKKQYPGLMVADLGDGHDIAVRQPARAEVERFLDMREEAKAKTKSGTHAVVWLFTQCVVHGAEAFKTLLDDDYITAVGVAGQFAERLSTDRKITLGKA